MFLFLFFVFLRYNGVLHAVRDETNTHCYERGRLADAILRTGTDGGYISCIDMVCDGMYRHGNSVWFSMHCDTMLRVVRERHNCHHPTSLTAAVAIRKQQWLIFLHKTHRYLFGFLRHTVTQYRLSLPCTQYTNIPTPQPLGTPAEEKPRGKKFGWHA